MVDRLSDGDIREFLEKGYLQVRASFTMMGKPKEHLEKTLQDYTQKIFEDAGFKAIQVDLFEAKEVENSDILETFAEVEFLVESIEKLNDFAFNYLPGTIEVLEPNNKQLTNYDLTNLYQSLTMKLHKVDAMVKRTLLEKNKLEQQLKK